MYTFTRPHANTHTHTQLLDTQMWTATQISHHITQTSALPTSCLWYGLLTIWQRPPPPSSSRSVTNNQNLWARRRRNAAAMIHGWLPASPHGPTPASPMMNVFKCVPFKAPWSTGLTETPTQAVLLSDQTVPRLSTFVHVKSAVCLVSQRVEGE